jgi:hypothetical protein
VIQEWQRKDGFFSFHKNLVLELCADGIRTFRGKKVYSLWLILLGIRNLPANIRYQPGNFLVLAVVPGPKETIKVRPILEMIRNELLQLEKGVPNTFDIEVNANVTFRARLWAVISDYIGSCKLSEQIGKGGRCGCRLCNAITERSKYQKKQLYPLSQRFLPPKHPLKPPDSFGPPQLKSSVDVRLRTLQIREAERTLKRSNSKKDQKALEDAKKEAMRNLGLKGISPLMNLPYNFVSIDDNSIDRYGSLDELNVVYLDDYQRIHQKHLKLPDDVLNRTYRDRVLPTEKHWHFSEYNVYLPSSHKACTQFLIDFPHLSESIVGMLINCLKGVKSKPLKRKDVSDGLELDDRDLEEEEDDDEEEEVKEIANEGSTDPRSVRLQQQLDEEREQEKKLQSKRRQIADSHPDVTFKTNDREIKSLQKELYKLLLKSDVDRPAVVKQMDAIRVCFLFCFPLLLFLP